MEPVPFLIIVPALLAIMIYMLSFKEGKQTCDNYILVAYLYALFYIMLMAYAIAMITTYIGHLDIPLETLLYGVIGIMFVDFMLLIMLLSIPKTQFTLKHVISIIYVLISSLSLAVILITFAPKAIAMALILTIMLFVVLTIIAWKFQKYISSRVSLVFLGVFILFVFLQLGLTIFFNNSIITTVVIFIVLMLVCYLLLVKTKALIENEQECTKDGVPDYVKEGIGLMLSFQSIFIQILQILTRGKMGGGRRRSVRF